MILKDTVTPELKRFQQELNRLKKMKIHVGIQGDEDSELLTVARVHEYGATIQAKNVKNLAIPIHKDAVGKSPRDFPGLFFIKSDNGYLFGCIDPEKREPREIHPGKPTEHKPKVPKAKPKELDTTRKELKYLFLLMPSVRIPERSFIRGSYDNKKTELEKACAGAVEKILRYGWNAKRAAEYIGGTAVGITQLYFYELTPPKSEITMKTAGGNNMPLVMTNQLKNSITFRIEEEE